MEQNSKKIYIQIECVLGITYDVNFFMYSNTSIMSYVINNSILTVILDPILAIMIFVFFLKSPKIIVLKE